MEVIVTIVSKLVYFTYLRDLQPTYKGVIIHLLSTMDIPVVFHNAVFFIVNLTAGFWGIPIPKCTPLISDLCLPSN